MLLQSGLFHSWYMSISFSRLQGIATENKNVVRIAIVTAIFVIETIVLIVKEMNKRKKTA